MRFVLNWGDTPLDLDAHLVTPSIGGQPYHVYWNATGSSISPPYAVLDYDVTEGYGPETMTIYDFYSGTYTFYIHNYSESPDLSTSNGTVQIYGESGYITTVAVPANDSGLYWNVCTVDGSNGQVAIVNDLVGSAPALGPPGDYNILKSSPRNQTWSWDFGDNNTSSEQNPTHTYETSGTYDVTLTVSDGSNYSTTIRYEYISVTSGSVSIENEQIPIKFVLHQNHPNPFNPVTTLNYDLQKNGLVTIAIYDMLGKKVKTIINQYQDAGYRTVIWDATNDYGKPVSAGIYLYQIQAGEYLQTKKMVLLK
jgi:PKD repeat protein